MTIQTKMAQGGSVKIDSQDILAVLSTARFCNAPCGTLQQLCQLGVRKFYHNVVLSWKGKSFNGGVLLNGESTTEAYEVLLSQAYGSRPAEKALYQEKANSQSQFIRANPEVLKRYLTHGIISRSGTPRLLTAPSDYLALNVRVVIKEVYCAPPEYSSRRFHTLVSKDEQSFVGIITLLTLAFGAREVRKALAK